MLNVQSISLEGIGAKDLPQISISFSNGNTFCQSNVTEADYRYAKRHNIEITKVIKLEFDSHLFQTSQDKLDDLKSLSDCFQYALSGQGEFVEDYEKQFFAFYNQLKAIKEKISDIELGFVRNHQILEAYKRDNHTMRGGESIEKENS